MIGGAPSRQLELSRAFFIGAFVAALLLALACSAAPQLHAWIHNDSAAATHQCAVTLMSSGSCDHITTALPQAPQIDSPPVSAVLSDNTVFVSARFEFSILEHAPPQFS